jgi:hypothetical protein
MDALGIDRRFLAPMIVMLSVKRAVGHLRLFRSDAETPPRSRTDNRYVGYVRSLAEDVDGLFTP